MPPKGYKQTAEHRANAAVHLKGNTNNKGKHWSAETRAKISKKMKEIYLGENNPAWKGGVSFEPYCKKFSQEFKNRVRNFFDNVCVECGKTEENKSTSLHVHHVNFDKMTCCNDVEPLFVALCKSCHSKTNTHRDYWEAHFTSIINDKYGGKCYLPKE